MIRVARSAASLSIAVVVGLALAPQAVASASIGVPQADASASTSAPQGLAVTTAATRTVQSYFALQAASWKQSSQASTVGALTNPPSSPRAQPTSWPDSTE